MGTDLIKRLSSANAVPLKKTSMVDANGNTVPFDSQNMYLDKQASGL